MKTDCEKLKEASIYVKEWIDDQPFVKEESLTDWLLREISKINIERFRYKAFTRNEESKTGADWEWWIVFDYIAYGIRVQAKKAKDNNYRAISCYPDGSYNQINNLIQDAEKSKMLPLYAFYTKIKDDIYIDCNISDEGVYFIGASYLNNRFVKHKSSKISISDILEESIPMTLLLCPNEETKLRKVIEVTFGKDMNNENLGRFNIEQLPSYVSILLQPKYEKIPDWFELELKKDVPKNVNAIMIVDNRNKTK